MDQDGGGHDYLHSHGSLVMVNDLNHHKTTETRDLPFYVKDKSLALFWSMHFSGSEVSVYSQIDCLSVTYFLFLL